MQYPTNQRAALQDEEARIQAQFVEATPETIEESNREQIVLESLKVHEGLKELPDFLKETRERRERLLTVIRTETPQMVANERREHIRRMNHMLDSMTKDQKEVCDDWHTSNIREKGLKATLIDLISSDSSDVRYVARTVMTIMRPVRNRFRITVSGYRAARTVKLGMPWHLS
jgi:hypothetical protein